MQQDETCGRHSRDHPGLVNPMQQFCYSLPCRAALCNGVSGGPIVYKVKGKDVCLIGVSTFFANPCENPVDPGIFIATGYSKIG